MRVPRLYTGMPLVAGESLVVEDRLAHYMGQVLRMRTGRDIILFNGDGHSYTAQLENVSKKQLSCRIIEQLTADNTQSKLAITLGIAISKGDRFDWVVQKATELGVAKICPLFSERVDVKLSGERLLKKQGHWRQVMISACEQSGRNHLVEMATAEPLENWVNNQKNDLKFVLSPSHSQPLNSDVSPPQSISLLIGPEGGLSDAELQSSIAKGFQALQLGPRILRTETAPLAAISVLQFHWGDMA
ncbi:MAG: 16S rRNA (uracil(1498)-N(3))-methyltransferase [Spongiibacteraceae bacterium]